MSGVVNPDRIKREDVVRTLKDYHNKVLSKIPGFVSYEISGSYNSDMSKNDFGDIDLIVHIEGPDKVTVKQAIIDEISTNDTIIPFEYRGKTKRYYNAGELITVKYPQSVAGKTVQIDNIIALNKAESDFKKRFLDMPAEVQGFALGFIKVAAQNFPELLKGKDPNLEFDLSSVSLRLRDPQNEIVWQTQNWHEVVLILKKFGLSPNSTFDDFLRVAKTLDERSRRRIKGLFSKMITVKSGEVGTPKGDNKIKKIEMVNTLAEDKIFGFKDFQRFKNDPLIIEMSMLDDVLNMGSKFLYHWNGLWIINTFHGLQRILERFNVDVTKLKSLFKRSIETAKAMGLKDKDEALFFSRRLNQGFVGGVDHQGNIHLITFLPPGKSFARQGTRKVIFESKEYEIIEVD